MTPLFVVGSLILKGISSSLPLFNTKYGLGLGSPADKVQELSMKSLPIKKANITKSGWYFNP